MMYEQTIRTFRTPRGATVSMVLREGTNDYNTHYSALNEDEYALRSLYFEGRALDVGAYIGSVAIGLLVDNPRLTVIAVEPVPDNVEIIRKNAELNGVADRLLVLPACVGPEGVTTQTLHYKFRGSELAEVHAFVGNITLLMSPAADPTLVGGWADDHDQITVRSLDLGHLLADGPVAFAKFDCEGGEWDLFEHPRISEIPRIHGEWHPTQGHIQADVGRLLAAFSITIGGPEGGPGNFEAVRR